MATIKATFKTLKKAVAGIRKNQDDPKSLPESPPPFGQSKTENPDTSGPSKILIIGETGSGKSLSESPPSFGQSKKENLDTSDLLKILIIGETGSGKSTYVNYITNYFLQGSLQNLKVAIPSKFRPKVTETFVHCENDIQNTTQSKTDACNQYMFRKDSKQYLFLDTPGLSDTRGAEQDDKNITKIIDSVENLGGLTAVIVVVNGAVSRLTVNLRNVLARLRGNLPDIIMENVILVLTNVTRYAANFSVPALELSGNVYPYYMQNSAFSQDPQTWNPTALEALQSDWNQAMNEIDSMVETIDTFKTKSVSAFKNMKDIRNEIKNCMHEARIEVGQIQKMQDELAAFEIAVKKSDNDLVSYKDYTKERYVDKIEIIDAPFHSTLCQNCNHVCHSKCQLNEMTTVGAQIFRHCWAIRNGHCEQCVNKCSYTAHYHAKKTVQKTKEKLQDVLTDIKFKYDQASIDKSNYQKKIETTADAKKLLENAMKQKNNEIKQLCNQLRQICSGFNLAQELHALIDQLETEAAMLKNIETKQQANEFIRSMKEFCAMIEKDQISSQNNLPTMKIINTERPVNRQAGRVPSTNNTVQLSRQDPAPDSTSCANEGVLAAIRSVGQKKTKQIKNQKKSSKKTAATSAIYTSDREDENATPSSDKNSTENESDEETKKRRKMRKPKPLPSTFDPHEFKELNVDDLLTRYRTCKDEHKRNFMICELVQRSHGKSMWSLKTMTDIAEFTASTNKYCALGVVPLQKEYERLKQRITSITEPDILKISQVPSAFLIEIAAVYVLLQRALSQENPSININQQPPFNHQNNMMFSSPSLNRSPSFASPPTAQHYHTDQRQHDFTYVHQPPRPPPPPPYTAFNSPFVNHHPPSYDHQQHMFQPISRPTPVDSSSLHSAFNNMHVTSNSTDFHHDFLLSNKRQLPGSNGIDSAPSSSLHSPSGYVGSEENNHDSRKMTNAQLLSAFSDAHARRNYARSNVLYNELQRRCYGDHPTLIGERQALFDELCQAKRNQSLDKLKQAQIHIHQMIHEHLIDGDATRLNNIPPELIVEAGVMAHLIVAKMSHS